MATFGHCEDLSPRVEIELVGEARVLCAWKKIKWKMLRTVFAGVRLSFLTTCEEILLSCIIGSKRFSYGSSQVSMATFGHCEDLSPRVEIELVGEARVLCAWKKIKWKMLRTVFAGLRLSFLTTCEEILLSCIIGSKRFR
ncbi:hypothetical protein CDAR_501871 [Caerostris darwini]|uniref:Uncharacterized protein n=1 Tax=Caerostris darwini TaxID=1538125 RepID=A0AAV4TLV1_9ARAC|nr:hypothetical protein CDAR_501871 [Caerostris darwini]